MIIFDEKKYAEKIIRFGYYQTLQFLGKERRAVARYLKYDMGYSDYEITKAITNIKSRKKELYDDDVWENVMVKLLNGYDKSEYIKDYRVGISQTELDIILDQPTIELRNLLFVLLVYFKWARNTKSRLCMRGTDTWVKEEDLDCCKIAGLNKLRKSERVDLFSILYKKGVYKSDFIRKYNNIFTLPFVDDKKPVIVIDDFTEIIAHLENYIDPNKCTHCIECGALTYKTSNRQKACKMCSKNRKHCKIGV